MGSLNILGSFFKPYYLNPIIGSHFKDLTLLSALKILSAFISNRPAGNFKVADIRVNTIR
jgi:hypothetical protein